MEKINQLLETLKNKISADLQKKIDKFVEITNSIKSLVPEKTEDLTEALKKEIADLEEFASELETTIVEKLTDLVQKQSDNEQPKPPITETPTVETPPKPIDNQEEKPKKKSSWGIAAAAFLAVVTLGVYVYNKKE
jgi:hypothetical protein